MTDRYIELHAASAFSFLEGASQPEALIESAVALEMPAIALLDRNGVYGAARFHTSAKRNDVRAHVGAEIAVSSLGPRLTPPAWLPHQYVAEPARLALLCESREGYQNLCQLVTRFKMRETAKQEGAANFGDLQRYAAGLVCMTGGDEGPLAAALMRGGEQAGCETVERLVHIFGSGNVFIELQRHQEREEEWRNQAAIRIARDSFGSDSDIAKDPRHGQGFWLPTSRKQAHCATTLDSSGFLGEGEVSARPAGSGNFTATGFDPLTWKPNYPPPAFLEMTPQDTYWGANG
jgi:DNA polymerase III alpha subunit